VVVVSVGAGVVVGAVVDGEAGGLVTFGLAVVAICSVVATVALACGWTVGTVVEAGSSSRGGVSFGGEPPHADNTRSDTAKSGAATFRKLRDTWLRVPLK
jgi:hypothetical protein